MKIILTVEEFLTRGLWSKFCDLRKIADDTILPLTQEFILTEEEAQRLGLMGKQNDTSSKIWKDIRAFQDEFQVG